MLVKVANGGKYMYVPVNWATIIRLSIVWRKGHYLNQMMPYFQFDPKE